MKMVISQAPLTLWASRTLKSLLLVAVAATVTVSAMAQIEASARKQIEEIYAFKATFTPAEKKMSTSLVLASRAAQHQSLGKMARFYDAPKHGTDGRIAVEVTGLLTPSLMASEAMQGVDKASMATPRGGGFASRVRARVSEAQLLALASNPDVNFVREETGAHTNVGSVTSQGYISHRANTVIAGGVTGTGVKVGVLSDSASPTRVAALIASGDLPADVVVVPGQAGSGEDEGTAMMEIIHDVAPGAKLFFASAFNGEDSFAANIRALRFTYGCDIIVDDVSYFDEPAFQDGEIAQAVNAITADGGLYFSAAANSGNLSSGTSGTWEGDFNPSAVAGAPISTIDGPVLLNNFAEAGLNQTFDTLTSSPTSGVYLHWSDADGAAADDYDLFILNSTGTTVKGYGANAQTGTQDPFEFVQPSSTCGTSTPTGYCPAAGDRIVVALYSGARRALHIDTERATLSIATSGATIGHNAGASTFSTAAVYWNAARRGPIPFVGGSTNPDEVFSSDGPRKIFYNPDGSAITPGNFLFSTSGGTTLIKPDGAGADGVGTATPGFFPFFGTSAAAPHAAAVAALVKSAKPTLTNTQIRTILTGTALDNMAAGIDRDSGYGIVTAAAAVAAAKAMP